ncbi:MAG: Hsp20/alpha crystallin family protein, partial [Actinomycetota bacterium]|nr:Hsp20/alpha crystallin family protein [Actinomycetota bacterium]
MSVFWSTTERCGATGPAAPGVKREDSFLRSRTRRVGRFDYRLSLPADIEEGQVSASLSNGILTVQVP